MNINRVFSYQFEDKDWQSKLGLGALILLVPILNIAVTGYMIALLRNVMDDAPEPLPDWDDLGKRFIDGLILTLARLLYALPLLIVFLPVGIFIVSGLISGNGHLKDIGALMAGAGSLLLFCVLCAVVLYVLALSILFPAIEIIYARQGTFAACFDFRQAYEIVKKNTGPYFTAWIVNVGVSLVFSWVIGILNLMVSWIPCVGWIASLAVLMAGAMYLTTISSNLFGQLGQIAFGQGGPHSQLPAGS